MILPRITDQGHLQNLMEKHLRHQMTRQQMGRRQAFQLVFVAHQQRCLPDLRGFGRSDERRSERVLLTLNMLTHFDYGHCCLWPLLTVSLLTVSLLTVSLLTVSLLTLSLLPTHYFLFCFLLFYTLFLLSVFLCCVHDDGLNESF